MNHSPITLTPKEILAGSPVTIHLDHNALGSHPDSIQIQSVDPKNPKDVFTLSLHKTSENESETQALFHLPGRYLIQVAGKSFPFEVQAHRTLGFGIELGLTAILVGFLFLGCIRWVKYKFH